MKNTRLMRRGTKSRCAMELDVQLQNMKSMKHVHPPVRTRGSENKFTSLLTVQENHRPHSTVIFVFISGENASGGQVRCLVLRDQFADLCVEVTEPTSSGPIHSRIMRLVSLPSGLLKSYGDYGMFGMQCKTFSDDQYLKEDLYSRLSWKNQESVNCEEEMVLNGQSYSVVIDRNPGTARQAICFNPEGFGQRWCVDVPGVVKYMCVMPPSGIVFATLEAQPGTIEDGIFYKIGFVHPDPEPKITLDDFPTDFISIDALCTMDGETEPTVVVCGERMDLTDPNSSWISGYSVSGQILWRYNAGQRSRNGDTNDVHSVCADNFGNLFVAMRDGVSLFDDQGNCKKYVLDSEQDNLGQEGKICVAFRNHNRQLVVSHVSSLSSVDDHVKGVNTSYDPLSVFNFYQIEYDA